MAAFAPLAKKPTARAAPAKRPVRRRPRRRQRRLLQSADQRMTGGEPLPPLQHGTTATAPNAQRLSAEGPSGEPTTCAPAPPLPDERIWAENDILNAIRSAAPGHGGVLVRRGQRSSTVEVVQEALLAWGCRELGQNLLPRFGADGDFGDETNEAVQTFQEIAGITSDGLIGPVTLSRLDAFVAFGEIPHFPQEDCKVVPPEVPAMVINALADLGFTASSVTVAPTDPVEEVAESAGVAGIPIFCQINGGGRKRPPAGICDGTPEHVASIGPATFALCEFVNVSRMTAGAIERPRPGNEAGFVEMRALGLRLFGFVGQSLPTAGPGSSETDWQHGFIQTARNVRYRATYQRGWTSTREIAAARRDARGATVPAPWYSNESIPGFETQVGKQKIAIPGPIALGPEFIGTDPVGILDDPRVIFVDTVPIDSEPECPCSRLQTVEAKGELDTWLIVTPAGKGKSESEIGFLKHVAVEFDLMADRASGFSVRGSPQMTLENGRGNAVPILTGPIANDDLRVAKVTKGDPCPVTIPGVECPIVSPKGRP